MIVFGFVLMPLSGCAMRPPEIDISKMWSRSLESYGFRALYPMQEDVAIGDIFITMKSDDDSPDSGWPMRVTASDKKKLIEILQKTYEDRVTIEPAVEWMKTPSVPSNNSAASAEKEVNTKYADTKKTPASRYDIHAAGSSSPLRMKRIAVPGLAVARISSADLACGGSLYGATIRAAFGISANVGLEITLNGLEEVHLDLADAFQLIRNERDILLGTKVTPGFIAALIAQYRPGLLKAYCDGNLEKIDHDADVRLMVANEVLYTHQISYSYTDGSSLVGQLSAAAANAAIVTSSASSETSGTDTGTEETPSETTVGALQDIKTVAAAQAAAFAVLRTMAGTTAAPGGSLQAGLSRTGNVKLSDTYSQPMAVGFASPVRYRLSELLLPWQNLYYTHYRALPDQKQSFSDRVDDAFGKSGNSACGGSGAGLYKRLGGAEAQAPVAGTRLPANHPTSDSARSSIIPSTNG
ncbi:hypothetical protein AA0242T_0360 [Acetobacter aceti NRIC 0242]|nr:hypothetical protein [Acetobacter aceti]GBO79658.1 hypothetical protein AA0242T_0360 [Acetobacter aceti NRIC 0242]